jgi:sugar diacid utilization regulator
MSDLPAPLTSLVDAAISGDDPEQLICAAHRELHRPLGLVGPSGRALAQAPVGDEGARALAVAAAGARSRLVAPPGWRIVPIARGPRELGVLAVRGSGGALLDLLVSLLGEQLQRRELLRTQASAFLRRLVTDPDAGLHRPRVEARQLGLELADAYWPALLVWRHAAPRASAVLELEREAADGTLVVSLGNRLVLLSPAAGGAGMPAWFGQIVARARLLAPSAGAQAIVAEGPVELAGLSQRVAELGRLARLPLRADEHVPVLSAGRYALDRLLADVARRPDWQAFMDDQLGALIAWDRAHHGDLLTVLEAALDFPRHDHAARRCYMHRNTFRHRLRQAMDVLGHDLEDPDRRLALHVALKLRRSGRDSG